MIHAHTCRWQDVGRLWSASFKPKCNVRQLFRLARYRLCITYISGARCTKYLKIYPKIIVRSVSCYVPPSALQLVETLSSLVPDDVSATGHFASPVRQCGTTCRQTFELLLLWQLSRIYSRLIHLSSHITQHNFECPMLYGALVVTLWTCYGAL